jgi:hypothetical protein
MLLAADLQGFHSISIDRTCVRTPSGVASIESVLQQAAQNQLSVLLE